MTDMSIIPCKSGRLTSSYGKSNHLVAHVGALDCIHMDKVDLKANVKLIMLETWNYSMTQ